MNALKVAAWIAAIFLIGLGGWFGRVVPFSEQWPMFEALRTTASIIFAVIGAWLAIIYPERLRLSFHDAKAKPKSSANGSGELFTPVVNSTYILCIILLIGAVAPVLKKYGLPGNISVWRGISYSLLVGLTLWQLWTVLLTLGPADRIKSFMDREHRHRQNVDAIKGNGNKPQP